MKKRYFHFSKFFINIGNFEFSIEIYDITFYRPKYLFKWMFILDLYTNYLLNKREKTQWAKNEKNTAISLPLFLVFFSDFSSIVKKSKRNNACNSNLGTKNDIQHMLARKGWHRLFSPKHHIWSERAPFWAGGRA